MPREALEWYQGMLKKVYETPEFKEYLEQGALKPAWETGARVREVARRRPTSSTRTSWRRAGS